MPSQTELIGDHPIAPNIFQKWFACTDFPPQVTRCHRSLVGQINSDDNDLIAWLAGQILTHHYSPTKLERLKQKYMDIGFPRFAEQHRQIPRADKTKKGNATEIILIEYITSCQKERELYKAYKFRYNTNVDQSMKGDDALLVDIIKDKTGKSDLKVYLGEAKFRKTPDKAVLDELSTSLGKDKLPISYPFLTDELHRDPSTEQIANLLDDFIINEIKAKGNLIYTGLLLTNEKASSYVETNFSCDNNALVFISAGIKEPVMLIDLAYKKAEEMIDKSQF